MGSPSSVVDTVMIDDWRDSHVDSFHGVEGVSRCQLASINEIEVQAL